MTELELRNVYETHIREHMLGPGFSKEIISCSPDCSDEILDKDPLNIYSTGILYPQGADPNTYNLDDGIADDTDNDDGLDNVGDNDDEASDFVSDHTGIPDDQPFWLTDHFGLVACVPTDTNQIRVKISYAKYTKVEETRRNTVRVIVGSLFNYIDRLLEQYDNNQDVQDELRRCNVNEMFSELIGRDAETKTIWLKRSVRINSAIFPHIDKNAERDLFNLNIYLRMLFGDFYQREAYTHEKIIDVSSECIGNLCQEPLEAFNDVNDCHIYKVVLCKNGKKYIKILMRNANIEQPNVARWTITLFQPEINVSPVNSRLISYTEPIQTANDFENNNIEFIYRDVINYGKGVQCAVEWDNDQAIRTSFIPKSDVKKFSSKLDPVKDTDYCRQIGVDANQINECCRLFNLSHWQTDRNAYFLRLRQFVNGYRVWCTLQQNEANTLGNPPEANNIVIKQQELLERLFDNITYLENNVEAFECFKWANTAMLIQMTVARNENFKKNRDNVQNVPNRLSWFEQNGRNCSYFPFQLAFLLMNVKSTFKVDDPYRNDVVDLIWFPTGGGKTEAYLALTALTIIARRRSSNEARVTSGVSVLMRYTLRLLTSQQFERASYLICALEFLRQNRRDINLGNTEITIGLWIGNSQRENLRPNKKWGKFNNLNPAERANANNPYPITYCPWCGQKLVTNTRFGYVNEQVSCINDYCLFTDNIPVKFVTEDVEAAMPTLLFATVDKLAGLNKRSAAQMFGYGDDTRRPLDLIIQDELHLISGPLGSMVGFFESVVEKMATKNNRRPKIIASTATTRNTESLIANLYNQREVRVFPAQGLTYADNYFSHIEERSLRRHIGICMQRDPVQSEVRLVAQMLLARLKVIREELISNNVTLSDQQEVYNALCTNNALVTNLDNFWTQVLYYNSLKDLGRMHSRIGQEVEQSLHALMRYVKIPDSLKFAITGVYNRVKEFTSREDSSRIKDLLTQAETSAEIDTTNNMVTGNTIDLVLASNMISVGIDINRWNVMLMSGQPRSTSEYIQSSSRVGRTYHGLVINEYSPMRIREKSMFENFTSFHAAYYKYVEPLSATPVTMQTLNHPVFNNIIACYKQYFTTGMAEPVAKQILLDDLTNRFNLTAELREIARGLIDRKWTDNQLPYAKSLRDIDSDCYTSINQITY